MKYYLSVIVLFGLLIQSCKKDRITGDKFESMDAFFETNKVEEQEFIITSEDSTIPIIGNQGTELFVGRRLFKFLDRNDAIELPYSIKLVELYTCKDALMYQVSSSTTTNPLENKGQIRVRACKSGEELELISGNYFVSNFSSTVSSSDFNAYQEKVSSSFVNSWLLATDGSTVSVSDAKYSYKTFALGWLSPAKLKTSTGVTAVTFEVEGSGGESITLAICFDDFHGPISGKNLELKNVPIGEKVTVLGMAQDQNGKFRLHKSSVTITASMVVKLDMKIVEEADLLSTLGGL